MTNKVEHQAALARIADFSGNQDEIREQLAAILASPAFRASRRSRDFLRFVVDKALAGRFDDLKERIVGIELFGRNLTYDTSQDAIVRVTANDVRKRLGHYYQEPGPAASLLIELPSGSYIPKFDRRTPPLEPLPTPSPRVRPFSIPSAGRRGAWVHLAWIHLPAYLLALLGIALGAWLLLRAAPSRPTPLPLPLSAVFQKDRQPQLIFSDASILMLQTLLHTKISLADYAMHNFLPKSTPSRPQPAALLDLLTGPNFTATAPPVDVRIASMLSGVAGAQSTTLRLRSAREMQFRDFKSDNDFILLGSPRSNPWTGLFQDQLDFSFVPLPGQAAEACHNAHPRPGELPLYLSTGSTGQPGHAYAIAAFLRNPNQNGNVLLLAGADAEGTEAAAQFITNPTLLSSILRAHGIPPNGPTVHFEALLRLTTIAGSPDRFQVIALHRL